MGKNKKDLYKDWRLKKSKGDKLNRGLKVLVWGSKKDLCTVQFGRALEDCWAVTWYADGGASGNDQVNNKNDINIYLEYLQREFEYDTIPKINMKKLLKTEILEDGEWGIY